MDVIYFETCIPTETILDRYKGKSNNELSSLLLEVTCSKNASAILYAISINERKAIKSLSSEKLDIGKNFPPDELYSRDDGAFSQNFDDTQLFVFIIILNGLYQGHVYAWPCIYDGYKQVINIMGIRSSIARILSQEENKIKITPILMAAIYKWCKQSHSLQSYMRVLSPFPIMQKILNSYGFIVASTYEHTNLHWLLEDGYVGDGPITCDDEVFDHTVDYIHNVVENLPFKFVNEFNLKLILQ